MRRNYPWILLAALGLLSGCRETPAPPAAPTTAAAPAPAVVLVVIDTLRADHLGCYGYPRPTSPRLDAFAAGATLHTHAFASSPWTLPSHASLFTGLDPYQHGAHTVLVDGAARERPLADDSLTLAEALQAEGYATAAFAANAALLRPSLNLDQGFDRYYVEATTADRLVPRAIDWLHEHRSEQVFLFLNLMDTHKPYNASPRPGLIDPPPADDGGALLDSLYPRILPANGPLPSTDIARLIDQFDTAIAHADEAIGTLLDALADDGRLDGSLVVVTSDHGEYFGEHHLIEHSKDVYQPALHVPLLIKAPGQAEGRVVEAATSSADTLRLLLAQLPGDLSERVPGRFPPHQLDGALLSENRYSRDKDLNHPDWGHRFRRERTAYIAWPLKYVRSSDGHHELYNLVLDPEESTNLVPTQPDLAADLARALDAHLRDRPAPDHTTTALPKLTFEELQALRALGYIR